MDTWGRPGTVQGAGRYRCYDMPWRLRGSPRRLWEVHARHSTACKAIAGAAETYLWLLVCCLASHDIHICEVSGLSVVLQVCRPHHSHLGAQVQLLAQVGPPLPMHPPSHPLCSSLVCGGPKVRVHQPSMLIHASARWCPSSSGLVCGSSVTSSQTGGACHPIEVGCAAVHLPQATFQKGPVTW